MASDRQIAMLIGAARKRRLTVPCDEYVAPLTNADISTALVALEAGRDHFAGHGCEDEHRHMASDAQAGRLFKIAMENGVKPLSKAFVTANLSADEVRTLCDDLEAGRGDVLANLRALESAAEPNRALPSRPTSQRPAAAPSEPRTTDETPAALLAVLEDIAATLRRVADRLETS